MTIKFIEGYNDHYMVGTNGDIISVKKGKQKIRLSPKSDKDGYLEVGLWLNGTVKYKKVHQLVASAFLDNKENKPRVNHKDFDRANNCVSNLEWVTAQEDSDHKAKHGRMPKGESCYCFGKKRGSSNTAKLVLDLQTGVFYDCAKDAAEAKNINYSTAKGKLNGNDINNTFLAYV